MKDTHLDGTSSFLRSQNHPYKEDREIENYMFSRFILLFILVTCYPFMNKLEEAVDISIRANSFLLSNFIYLSTVAVTPVVYVFYKKIAKINNIELLLKWEKDHPEYYRIYWMNPLTLRNNLSLKGKLGHLILNSILLSSVIITTSLSISLIFVFVVFESNLNLIIIIALLAVVLPVMIGQVFMVYDVVYSASGLYLFEGSLVIRTALIFRSLPDKIFKPDKLDDFFIKEINSFQFDVPMHHSIDRLEMIG
ncbi:MAG: hypothetical protein GPJ54_16205 [Candidatus Heimdallarchaeota archaeon]|nr:hypothetical protein [Candidatus Heimdallarchaeota archaeon]